MKYDRAEAVRYMGAKKYYIERAVLADLLICSCGTKCGPEAAGRFLRAV